MNCAEFTRLLIEKGQLKGPDTSQRVRLLREAGLIQTGGHGRHAADIQAFEAAYIVLGLAAPSASRVVEVTQRLAALRLVPEDNEPSFLVDAVQRLFGTRRDARTGFFGLSICVDTNEATVVGSRGIEFFNDTGSTIRCDQPVQVQVEIDVSLFEALALELVTEYV